MENMTRFEMIFLVITFLFMIGSMYGWVIELLFRRFISRKNPSRKWINPGFLIGPCLPLYGFGLVALFVISNLPYVGIEEYANNRVIQVITTILTMGVMMTVIEYFAGMIFIKGMKIKLWDYSDEPLNIQGIICIRFSVIWTVLAAVYYFFIQQYVIRLVRWFDDNIAFTFIVGMFYGILVIDLCYSFNVVSKVRRFAVENEIVIKYEALKQEIRMETDAIRKKGRFLLALKPERTLVETLREKLEQIR